MNEAATVHDQREHEEREAGGKQCRQTERLRLPNLMAMREAIVRPPDLQDVVRVGEARERG